MVPQNILQQVITWNMADLKVFQNDACFVSNANTIFKDPERFPGNLGATVSYETPPQLVPQQSLVVNFDQIQQRARTLTVNKEANVSYAGTAEEIIFNSLEEYAVRLGDVAMANLATEVEADVATLCESIPYRFYGNGQTQIASVGQLAQALANFRAYSTAPGALDVYLDVLAVPQIITTLGNQFVMDRNEEQYRDWMVMDWDGANFYQSNLLPVHTSGSVGQNGLTLTITSTNDPTSNNITVLNCSGAGASDPLAIALYDSAQFVNNGSNVTPTWLTWTGYKQTSLAVQLLITAPSASDSGGNVVLNIYPPLCATPGSIVRNIQNPIVPGMQLKLLPSCKFGAMISDKALYVAMPKLPSTFPFPSAEAIDENTQVSVRLYYGIIPFKNVYGWTRDCIWGKDGNPTNWMKLAFTLNTGTGIGM